MVAGAWATIVAGIVGSVAAMDAIRTDGMVANEPVVAATEWVALVLLVTGAWSSVRRPIAASGCALVATGIGVPILAGVPGVPAWATSMGIGFAPLMVAAAVMVAVEFAGVGRRTLRVLPWILAGAAAALIAASVAPIEEAPCLRRCPDVAVPLADLVGSSPAVAAGAAVSLISFVGAARAVSAHSNRFSGPAAGALVAVLLMAVAQGVRAAAWTHIGAWPWGAFALAAGAAVLGGTVLAERLGRIRVTAAVRRATERLRGGAVGRAIFPGLDGDGWLDAEGRPVADRGAFPTELVDDEGVVAMLAIGSRPRTVSAGELDPVDLLAIRNARMTATALAQVAWLEESQRAITAASRHERERIEHDLHDGAQQRLVSALLFLAVARRELADSEVLTDAESQIRIALERLRELSHGPGSRGSGSRGSGSHDGREGRST